MNQDLQFNFHDLVGVRVTTGDQVARKFYLQEFRRAAGDAPANIPEVVLSWRRRSYLERVPPEYRKHVHKLLARWGYRIHFEEGRIRISALGNTFALPMVHHMLLQPSIRYLCCMQDVLMMHGSSVVFDGKSVIFTGSGGAGKTTSSSLILQYGGTDWHMHADDYLFVHPTMQTKGFLTRAHLYRAILDWIPEKKAVLTLGERMRLDFLGRLRSLTRDGLKWPLRISEGRLWPEHSWAESADLGAVIMLRKGDADGPRIEAVQVEDVLVEDLVEMNFNEARHFRLLVARARGAGLGENWVDEWKQRERQLIEAMLLATPIYWLELPRKPEADRMGRELVEVIANLLNAPGGSS